MNEQPRLDADRAKTARDLQWPLVVGSIARRCACEHAADELRKWGPLPDRAQAETRSGLVREVLCLLELGLTLPATALADIGPLFAESRRGAPLAREQLRDVLHLLRSARALKEFLKTHRDHAQGLNLALSTDPSLAVLEQELNLAIDDQAQILDSASDELRGARRRLFRAREAVKAKQGKLLSRYSRWLSGHYFAEREGRFVLPVRSDATSQIDGIVHGSSSSGGTLYVEPKELTSTNNALRLTEAEVLQEEEKVLLLLSAQVHAKTDLIEDAFSACTYADQLLAVASWAKVASALPLVASTNPELRLYGMRHPLLIEGQEPVVPNDLELSSSEALIVSGPNAGGKTVSLKSLGLAAWLVATGLPVPCDDRSRVGWFDEVLTDIGDDQSISHSLSTFSAHVTHLAHYLRRAKTGVLVLLDEVAGGTDPNEGSALAVAVIETLVHKGAAVAATTHYERLKELGASKNPAFVNASVGFDLERMQPTFHLTLGVPGPSSALDVAERFGIESSVIARAKAIVPQELQDQRAIALQLERERQKLTAAREEAEREAREQRQLRERFEQERSRVGQQERERLRREAASLTRELQTARGLLQRAKKDARDSSTKGDIRRAEKLVNEAAKPLALGGTVNKALQVKNPATVHSINAQDLAPGARLLIPHLDAQAEFIGTTQKGLFRVSIGGLKMTLPKEQVVLSGANKQVAKPRTRTKKVNLATAKTSSLVRSKANTCDLRGQRVDAGLDQVEAFLDQMLQSEEPGGFVLHGHGTGAMKDAVRRLLSESTCVSRWEPAAREDGGDALSAFWL